MVRDKVRIRFRKAGDLRWTSHHDLMRCFERMLRRAALPFSSTEGFNPRPRLVFAQPLPLGLVSSDEVADLELHEVLPPDEIRQRLAQQAPPGLAILSVDRVDMRTPIQPRRAVYRFPVPDERCADLIDRAAALLTAGECWVERTRPVARCLDVRPFLADVRVAAGAVELHLLITPNGGARPEELLRVLGLGDLLDAGAVIERTTLELPAVGAPPEVLTNREPQPDSCTPGEAHP